MSAPCDLCGHEFPVDFLVAAHIKPRAKCTDEERNDLRNVAMLACAFGCDRLFESGYVTVDADGTVRATKLEAGLLHSHLARLDGRPCKVHERSESYFTWHRDHVYRG